MQFDKAIRIVPCVHGTVCHGFQLEIIDQAVLAKSIAWIALGHYAHVEKILNGLAPKAPRLTAKSKKNAAEAFELAPGAPDQHRWNRDGLVFQHISWMALQIQNKGQIAISIPHPRVANKGFDALMVPLKSNGTAHEILLVCEDKATDDPRKFIRDRIWPEIERIEDGNRDNEITSELTALLRMYEVKNADAVITAGNWAKRKHYKICVTITTKQNVMARRANLFDGYDTTVVDKAHTRRRADTLAVDDMRDWMDELCIDIQKAIMSRKK